MPINKFASQMAKGKFLSGKGRKTQGLLDGASAIGSNLQDAAMTGISMLPGIGIPLAAGAAIGTYMQNNVPKSSFTSGRGSGARATTNPSQSVPSPTGGVMGGLPHDYKETEAAAFVNADRWSGKSADLRGSMTPSNRAPAATNVGEDKAMAKAEEHRAGAGYPKGVTMPQDYTFTNPNGVQQTVKNLGNGTSAAFVPEYANSSFNDLLSRVGGGQFKSNNLPGAEDNPFTGGAPKTQSFNTEAESYTDNKLADFASDGGAAAAQPGTLAKKDEFNPDAARIEGGSSRKPGGSLAEALAHKDGINKYMSEYSSGDRERMARRAFLDGDDSYKGLRAKEAVNGVVYAGGKHYMSDKSGDDQAIYINRGQARDISNGKTTAQDLLTKHIAKNKDSSKDTASDLQNPETTFNTEVDLKVSTPNSKNQALDTSNFDDSNNDGNSNFSEAVDVGTGKSKLHDLNKNFWAQ